MTRLSQFRYATVLAVLSLPLAACGDDGGDDSDGGGSESDGTDESAGSDGAGSDGGGSDGGATDGTGGGSTDGTGGGSTDGTGGGSTDGTGGGSTDGTGGGSTDGTGGDSDGGTDGGTGGVEPCEDYRMPDHTVDDVVVLADGLTAEFLTRDAGHHTDMMVFWPHEAENPTHLITCVEGSEEIIDGGSKKNPAVQRISLADGTVETILRGMDRCDGLRTTAWGTVLATEETVDGSGYEILDPLTVTNYTITDRAGPGEEATIEDASGADGTAMVAKRPELPTMAWEGLTVTDGGVVIGGDELRPGSWEDDRTGMSDTDGGAIFKFVPNTPFAGGAAITDLANSPLTAGTSWALQISCRDDRAQVGQGCEIGNGQWVSVDPDTARESAHQAEATGYYRPEDLHADPTFEGDGIRFCWANTGNTGGGNHSEVICGVDSDPMSPGGFPDPTVVVNRFVEGDGDFAAADNLAFQPTTGTLYVIEDRSNGDIFACLPDGDDRDIKTDGCVKMLSLMDASTEPTGFLFTPDGLTAYVSSQHSADCNMDPVDDYGTDDVLKITGFMSPSPSAIADFGGDQHDAMVSDAANLFGFNGEVAASSEQDLDRATTLGADLPSAGASSFGNDASVHLDLAPGLSATYLTRYAGHHTDMYSLWPSTGTPTHIVTCVEGSREVIDGGSLLNPGVQTIDLATGEVATVLRGLDRCDGIRTTPWGTVLATEETVDGSAYEILNPLDGVEYTIEDRGMPGTAATIVNEGAGDASDRVAKRFALPTMAWEGLTVTQEGVVIGGDELRPGSYEHEWSPMYSATDTDGGGMFKFVPNTLQDSGPISDLADSPLVGGTTYALQISCRDDRQQYGQGCEIGNGSWIEVDADNAREDAYVNGATGYYRPEDLHTDPTYTGDGMRFCFANTGNKGAQNWSEVICGVDSDPTMADPDGRAVVVNRFIEGDPELNAADNLEFQPTSGNLYVIEDNGNGDIWACLPDGDDRDIKSDGCIRILSLHNPSAEPTGFMFMPDGQSAILSIQHTDDSGSADLLWDNYGTDDVIVITGFGPPAGLSNTSFGPARQAALESNSMDLFGFGTPLTDSATQP